MFPSLIVLMERILDEVGGELERVYSSGRLLDLFLRRYRWRRLWLLHGSQIEGMNRLRRGFRCLWMRGRA